MHANEQAQTPESKKPARSAVKTAHGGGIPAGLLALQSTAGNAAVVQMLRAAGHGWAQPEQHQHGAGCGHQQSGQPAVQRSAVHDVLRTGGRPLDDGTRTDMEARLGADFSDVRIHNDGAAKASAAEVGARAYTSGNHVVIGDGGNDKHTLAHELTHVIQQRQGPVAGTDNGNGLKVSDPSDRFEREAEENAQRVMAGDSSNVQVSGRRAPATESADIQRALTHAIDESAHLTRYTPTKAGAQTLPDAQIKRPKEVKGRVEKTGTAGRPAAPNPLTVTSLHEQYSKAVSQARTQGNSVPTVSESEIWADLFGGAGYDRGHIMGLEVGGMDDPRNIVPQWSLNQQSGDWRSVEKELVKSNDGDDVVFTIDYASDNGSYQTVMVPTNLSVHVIPTKTGGQPKTISWDNEPDENDLFRSGLDPEDPKIAYKEARDKLGHSPGSILNQKQIEDLAFRAVTYLKAHAQTMGDYERGRIAQQQAAQNQQPIPSMPPSRLDDHWDRYKKAQVPKKKREQYVDMFIAQSLIASNGAGQYQLS